MNVLLISTYESGHQPWHVASPAAALLASGHEVKCLDLSVEDFDADAVTWADFVCFSIPMHTALRLAISVAERVRALASDTPVVFYGLYASAGRDETVARLADRVIAGEYEGELIRFVGGQPQAATTFGRRRESFYVPARQFLPDPRRYAHLRVADEEILAGYVETSHGCRHRCRHCPLPVIYDGRYQIVTPETVLADVAQLVAEGVRHVTIGDPDFLNGPAHARRVIDALHSSFPDLTFDATVKVEHIVRNAQLWDEFASRGLLFVVSAFETTSTKILNLLDKGHTPQEMADAVRLLRRSAIELRPTWLPFTPWTALGDLEEILGFIADHDLYENTDPVQLTIRLLIPEGSLLLDLPELVPYLGNYDPEALTYTWRYADPRLDSLQAELSEMAARGAEAGADPHETLGQIWHMIMDGLGLRGAIPSGATVGRPRMTEPWFC